MAKLSLNNITSGFASNTALNANFDAIEAALENTVSRDGTTPNQMTADLDMNGNRILNALADSGDGFVYEGGWTTSTAYTTNDLVYVPVGTGSSYDGFTLICKVAHTSGILNTDYSAGKWGVIAARGASGGGSGDLVAINNLSELSASAATARSNIAAAKSGANTDITSLSNLPLAIATTTTTQASALTALGAALNGVLSKSAAYSVTVGDRGKLIDFSGLSAAVDATLPVVADGLTYAVRNSDTTYGVTLKASATIDGAAGATGITLNPGESCLVVGSATEWKTIGKPQKRFVSSNQAITSAGTLTIAHGLGITPYRVDPFLYCETAEYGFSIGDVITASTSEYSRGVAGRGMAITWDSTNIYVRYGNWTQVFEVVRKDTGVSVALTNANWKLRLGAIL